MSYVYRSYLSVCLSVVLLHGRHLYVFMYTALTSLSVCQWCCFTAVTCMSSCIPLLPLCLSVVMLHGSHLYVFMYTALTSLSVCQWCCFTVVTCMSSCIPLLPLCLSVSGAASRPSPVCLHVYRSYLSVCLSVCQWCCFTAVTCMSSCIPFLPLCLSVSGAASLQSPVCLHVYRSYLSVCLSVVLLHGSHLYVFMYTALTSLSVCQWFCFTAVICMTSCIPLLPLCLSVSGAASLQSPV